MSPQTTRLTLLLLSFGLITCGGGGGDDGAGARGQSADTRAPRNIILMIADGASWGSWDSAAYWATGRSANERISYRDLPVRLGVSTYPLNFSTSPTHTNASLGSYNATLAWDESVTPPDTDSYAISIAGYRYLKQNTTDSAAAATAMASGVKTYNSAINHDNFGQPLEFITRLARASGRAAGVVSSVQFSHATPAAFGAQNASRGNLVSIATSMLREGNLDLLMGTGHPGYDHDGIPLSSYGSAQCASASVCSNPYDTLSQVDWDALRGGRLTPAGSGEPWEFIDSKAQFEQLASGSFTANGPIAGIPRVRGTLQQGRSLARQGADASLPSGVARISSVPELATMASGALRHLGRDPDGLFLMIEGGAVDWAAHANQAGRLIEEHEDFARAVDAVKAWVEQSSSWDETLLIVTTDHGNGLPLGTDSDVTAFAPVTNRGVGVLPGLRFWSSGHSNELVRLWARGRGSEQLMTRVRGSDLRFATVVGHNPEGFYIDNTDIFQVMKASLGR